jgi:ribonuclease HII
MEKLICGVDEAGRGPILGPLIVAGIAIKESDISKLTDLEVKDSKLHSPKRRQELFKEITKIAQSYEIIKVPAQEIDSRSTVGLNLNSLEALKAANVIDKLKPDIAYVDSPTSPDGARFETLIREPLKNQDMEIKAGHKFDYKYPVVSAASILAKVVRDEAVDEIRKEVGEDIGSGYPADEITQKFLKEHLNNSVSKYIRKTWATWKNLQAKKDQSSLGEF